MRDGHSRRRTLGPLFLALRVSGAQHLLDGHVLASLHTFNDLPQDADFGLGLAEAVGPVLLEPQDLDGLAAHEQAEDDVRGGGIPGSRRGVVRPASQRFGHHRGPEARLYDARKRQEARVRQRRSEQGEGPGLRARGREQRGATEGRHAKQLAEGVGRAHGCGGVMRGWELSSLHAQLF
jgi:hypothetical protein